MPALLLAGLLLLVSPAEARGIAGAHRLDAAALLLLSASASAVALRRWSRLLAYALSLAFAAWFLALTHAPGPVFVAPFIALVAVIARARPPAWPAGAGARAARLRCPP